MTVNVWVVYAFLLSYAINRRKDTYLVSYYESSWINIKRKYKWSEVRERNFESDEICMPIDFWSFVFTFEIHYNDLNLRIYAFSSLVQKFSCLNGNYRTSWIFDLSFPTEKIIVLNIKWIFNFLLKWSISTVSETPYIVMNIYYKIL